MRVRALFSKKSKTTNLKSSSPVKFTREGIITVSCHQYQEPIGLRGDEQMAFDITVDDTGCGIESSKLESMFREFEQVESSAVKDVKLPGLGKSQSIKV